MIALQVGSRLVPLLNAALNNAQTFISGVVGKPVTLPTITGNELPSAACQKIATALDRPVPATCGQIALFPAKNLDNAQRAVRAFDRAVLALLIITPLLAGVALWLSRRRRRTLLQLTVGATLGVVIVRRALMWEQNQLIDAARPANKEARAAIVDAVLHGFFTISLWLVVAGLVITAIAVVTGPYRWAVATRRALANAGRRTWGLAAAAVSGTAARAQDQSTLTWVHRHYDALRIGGVVVAVLLLLIFSVNVWGFLVIAALLAVFEVWLHRLRPPPSITLPPPTPPGQAPE